MRHATGKEGILLAHDFGGDLQDGAGALIERAHKPGRVLQAVAEIGFIAILANRFRKLGVIDLVDEHARQRVAVEFDVPPAVGAGSHIDVRHHGLCACRSELQSRFWIEPANLGDHIGDVVVIDSAQFS